jgi:hypothetical protein
MAALVVLAQIDDQEELHEGQELCGFRYNATILENFKESSIKGSSINKPKKIIFGRYSGLKLYETYLLFLNYENNVSSSYERMAKEFGFYDKRKNIMNLIACNGTVPGYVFNRKIQWQVASRDVYFFGLIPEEMPPSVRVFQSEEGPNWSIPTDDLFPYLRKLREGAAKREP